MRLAEYIHIACLMEATARKPGNVHPQASFHDLTYIDFVRAAQATAESLSMARDVGLGAAILNSVRAARNVTATNVNLGIVLLLAPLAMVPEDSPLEPGLIPILNQTSVQDAEFVYEAIRISMPGGMGDVASQDIRTRPTVTLRDAMALGAKRDRIAEQYVTNYSIVFASRTKLGEFMQQTHDWESAIVLLHLWIMSRWPDTLIARKCGLPLAEQAAIQAAKVLETWQKRNERDARQFIQFDSWLRSDGNRRNPGTTADLIAATLFAALRDGLITAPSLEEIEMAASRTDQRPD